MALYCENCKSRIKITAKFCPECGTRLMVTAAPYSKIGIDNDVEQPFADDESSFPFASESLTEHFQFAEGRKNGTFVRSGSGEMLSKANASSGKRFNLSKPLCLLMALIMLSTFFFPWMNANAVLNQTRLFTNRGVNIFELPSFIKGCINTALKLAGPGSELTQEGEHLVWILNGLLLFLAGLFLLIAVHFVLFGIIGLFSAGKLRYYFARVGGTMFFFALILFIGIVFIGNAALGSLSRQTTAEGVVMLELSIAPTVYAYAAAVLALIFRFFGVRALRRLNAESCLNRGRYDIAKREIKLLRRSDLMQRIPQTHSN
ncbi:MAG: zinc ribbon domain-containing protein [Clostridia bacterium]|nr:zinc ribbon domain-containing protein [Clostridia bacterium]